MSLLQFIIIIAAVVFFLFGRDLYKRQKATILHYIVFIGGGASVIAFAFNNNLLNTVGNFFGIARGADLLVYIAILLLFFFYIELVNKQTKDKYQLTRLISQTAISNGFGANKDKIKAYQNTTEKDRYGFAIRVYNEESSIGTVIQQVINAGFHKIVCINDGSKDRSAEVIQEQIATHPSSLIISLSHSINRGGGAANQTAYSFYQQHADIMGIDRVVSFDADGQMSIEDMKKFMDHIKEDQNKKVHTDLYLGSRFIEGGEAENISPMRRLILRIAKLITTWFYGTRVSDPHNGFRVISKACIKKFHITADGMHYANEINEQIKLRKMQFKEVPTHIQYTEYSINKGQKNSNSLTLALEMIYKKLFFR